MCPKTGFAWLKMLLLAGTVLGGACQTFGQSADELAATRTWYDAHWGSKAATPPFSFLYGGNPFAAIVKEWKVERTTQSLDPQRSQEVIRYVDPKTGLEVRCVAVIYSDFPTVEWTVYLKNTGAADSLFVDNLYALDVIEKRESAGSEFLLRHCAGSWAGAAAYSPYETRLTHGLLQRLSAYGGRPSNTDMPYCNLEWDGHGAFIAACDYFEKVARAAKGHVEANKL
jgi:hypothetical protein